MLFMLTFTVLCALPLLLLRDKELDNALEDARRRRLAPTDYGTSFYRNLDRAGRSTLACSTPEYDSPSWRLIEIRRMQEHQEMMDELRKQTRNQQMMLKSDYSGPIDGGPIDKLWKGEW